MRAPRMILDELFPKRPAPTGEGRRRTVNGAPPARQRILDYLAAHGGSVESATGQGLTRELAQSVGYDDLSALNAMLTRLEREGAIVREIRGRRTYRIALSPGAGAARAGRGRRSKRGPGAEREDQVADELSHPRGQLRLCLLLLLHERPSHGYDLVERLKPFGYARDDPAQTYRALHWLEGAGLVEPTWETVGTGPARRVYHLTALGRRMVTRCAADLRERTRIIDDYLARLPAKQLQSVPEQQRAFEVLVEAQLAVNAPDEGSARQKVEEALGHARAINTDVRSTGQVWVYEATERSGRT